MWVVCHPDSRSMTQRHCVSSAAGMAIAPQLVQPEHPWPRCPWPWHTPPQQAAVTSSALGAWAWRAPEHVMAEDSTLGGMEGPDSPSS